MVALIPSLQANQPQTRVKDWLSFITSQVFSKGITPRNSWVVVLVEKTTHNNESLKIDPPKVCVEIPACLAYILLVGDFAPVGPLRTN